MKKRFPNAEDKYPIEIEMGLIDEKAKYLVGWPGYRTYFQKSALGYVETRAEWAHMQGVMLRMLLTGKFRTRNPIYLLFMFFLAIVLGILPLTAIVIELFIDRDYLIFFALAYSLPYIVLGILLLINTILSLLEKNGRSITGD